eukprot:s1085_g13.t1
MNLGIIGVSADQQGDIRVPDPSKKLHAADAPADTRRSSVQGKRLSVRSEQPTASPTTTVRPAVPTDTVGPAVPAQVVSAQTVPAQVDTFLERMTSLEPGNCVTHWAQVDTVFLSPQQAVPSDGKFLVRAMWLGKEKVVQSPPQLAVPNLLEEVGNSLLTGSRCGLGSMSTESSRPVVPMVLITGWSGAGKTTAGNYLELVHGWKHLDGDNIMHRKDAESLKLTEGLVTSFYSYWFKNLSAPPELWTPYLDALMRQCLEQRATARAGLAVTFSVYRREAREYLRQLVPATRLMGGPHNPAPGL